ncbi:MFS transporter [Bacillus sp. ISL-45]|uniref:MFS transporter n=1 Tax=Bacillus sp. ISL-45 TaxID=2819128 RepID=UPI001BE67BCC|nr:MFS transporter [Bacillus sp. ISL-45]MBT2661263.1 MFS transporter [Bacillus sp. ISL-45]
MFKTFNLEKSYQKLFFAGIINGIGDRFSQVALLALILQMTGSGLSVGITMALRMIPFLFFSPLSSGLARKFGRKNIMIVTDLARAVLALSFLAVNNPSDIWIVYVTSFMLASGEAIYAPIRKSSIPAIVSSKSLKDINGWEQVLIGIVLIIGALSGGIVSYLLGAKAAFLLNIVSFLAAGWILSTLPSLGGKIENEQISKPDMEKYSELLPVIAASSFLIMLMMFELIIPLINGIENVLLSVYAVQTFEKADLGVGIFYSVLGLGLMISPLLTKMVKKRLLLFSFICIIGEGLFLTSISQTKAFWVAAVLFGVTAIFSGVGNALLDTVAMETIPSKWHGMYFGITSMLSNTFIGVSMFLTGMALEWFDPRLVGMIGGIMYISAGTLFLIWSLKYRVDQEKASLMQKVV